jgi:hypothetical protein
MPRPCPSIVRTTSAGARKREDRLSAESSISDRTTHAGVVSAVVPQARGCRCSGGTAGWPGGAASHPAASDHSSTWARARGLAQPRQRDVGLRTCDNEVLVLGQPSLSRTMKSCPYVLAHHRAGAFPRSALRSRATALRSGLRQVFRAAPETGLRGEVKHQRVLQPGNRTTNGTIVFATPPSPGLPATATSAAT